MDVITLTNNLFELLICLVKSDNFELNALLEFLDSLLKGSFFFFKKLEFESHVINLLFRTSNVVLDLVNGLLLSLLGILSNTDLMI